MNEVSFGVDNRGLSGPGFKFFPRNPGSVGPFRSLASGIRRLVESGGLLKLNTKTALNLVSVSYYSCN
jgi:hypothetical protein